MIRQLEIEAITAACPPAPVAIPKGKASIRMAEAIVAMHRARERLSLSPALHSLLTSVATFQSHSGYATIPSIAISLGCTYQSIDQHLLKSPQLFHIERLPRPIPNQVTLSQEAIELLLEANRLTRHYLAHP